MITMNKNSYDVSNRVDSDYTPIQIRRVNEYYHRNTILLNDVYNEIVKHFVRNNHTMFAIDENIFVAYEMNRQDINWLNNHLKDLGYETILSNDVDDFEIQVSL